MDNHDRLASVIKCQLLLSPSNWGIRITMAIDRTTSWIIELFFIRNRCEVCSGAFLIMTIAYPAYVAFTSGECFISTPYRACPYAMLIFITSAEWASAEGWGSRHVY